MRKECGRLTGEECRWSAVGERSVSGVPGERSVGGVTEEEYRWSAR